MSEWQWFQDCERDACYRGDAERARLLQLHREGYGYREVDPDRTLALFAEGRRLSALLGEPWWVLLFDHWLVVGRIYYQEDFRNLIDLAVRNMLEVRKPLYAQFPQRLHIYNNVLSVYLEVDPLGHADAIRNALAYMQAEITPEMDGFPYLLLESRVWFALERDCLDEAQELTLRSLALADSDSNHDVAPHYSVASYGFLCQIAFKRMDHAAIGNWARLGEEAARQLGYEHPLARFIMWQALVAQNAGELERAQRLCRTAVARMTRLQKPPSSDYYDALCYYFERADKPANALRLRDRQLHSILDRGRLAYECDVRIKRCRLLATMAQLRAADLGEARESAQKLRNPAKQLRELEEIASGTSPAGT